MVEFRIQPRIKAVAGFACGRKIRACVIWIRRLPVVLQMAGNAGRWKALELADCGALVALFAWHGGMRTKKRKTVLVILHLLYGYVPTAHGVALCAVGSKLPSMNVCVAVRTVLSYVREHRFCVALRALHLLVHPAQWIIRVVVVEFGMRPNRPPPVCCVAIFAGNR